MIRRIREYPKDKPNRTDLLLSIGVIFLGAVLGYVAKAADSISLIGDIGTELGVWVFTATIVAVCSRYPYFAAINTMLFFLSMLGTYYLYGYYAFGFFPQAYFLGWLIVALLSPIAGLIVWFAKGEGIGAVVTALPVSILFAPGYPAFIRTIPYPY